MNGRRQSALKLNVVGENTTDFGRNFLKMENVTSAKWKKSKPNAERIYSESV